MTVAELGERMSSAEFAEWMAYDRIEPFGEERADLRQAMTTSVINNFAQAHSKNPQWSKPEDFMPFREKVTAQPKIVEKIVEPSSPESLMAKFSALTNRKGAVHGNDR